jgi:hypothetical protein
MKNKQPFTIEGSVPLKKALLEETGLSLDIDTLLEYRLLRPSYTGLHRLEGCYSCKSTHYILPQQYTEAVQAVKDFFAEDKLEKGKWYYVREENRGYEWIGKYRNTDETGNLIFSDSLLLHNQEEIGYYQHDEILKTSIWLELIQPATTEQIEFMLRKVAVQKGLVCGAIKYFKVPVGFRLYEKDKWAEIVPQEKPKPKFEAGRWYYGESDELERLYKFKKINHVGNWCYSECVINTNHHSREDYISNQNVIDGLKPATTEQIRVMLGKVAKQKGYVEGVEIKTLITTHDVVKLFSCDTNYSSWNDALWVGSCKVYEKGKWAEIVPQEKPKPKPETLVLEGVWLGRRKVKENLELTAAHLEQLRAYLS